MRDQFLAASFGEAVNERSCSLLQSELMPGTLQQSGVIESAQAPNEMLCTAREEGGDVVGPQEAVPGNLIEDSKITLGPADRLG